MELAGRSSYASNGVPVKPPRVHGRSGNGRGKDWKGKGKGRANVANAEGGGSSREFIPASEFEEIAVSVHSTFKIDPSRYARQQNNSKAPQQQTQKLKETAGEQPKLPPYKWRTATTKLHYIFTESEADRVLSLLQLKLSRDKREGANVLGFDLEWRPNFRGGNVQNPVALVQLATEDEVFLVQISRMQNIPESLVSILRDTQIIKVGVNIQGDAEKLFTDFAMTVHSCLELSHLARLVDNTLWVKHGPFKTSIGLARMCETYLGKSLPKGKVRLSNWEAALTEAQMEYAANDAHAGLALYKFLVSKYASDPAPLVDALYHHPISTPTPDALCKRVTQECTFNMVYKRALHPVTGLTWAPRPPGAFAMAYEVWEEERRKQLEEEKKKREAEKAEKAKLAAQQQRAPVAVQPGYAGSVVASSTPAQAQTRPTRSPIVIADAVPQWPRLSHNPDVRTERTRWPARESYRSRPSSANSLPGQL